MDEQNDPTPLINYEILVESALKDVVRSSLEIAATDGLPGSCHFFITFLTGHEGVAMPEHLHESHAEKMTIIIQHQFWNLEVFDDRFNITLSFGGKREDLTIPFAAILEFNDPSVGFGLQFSSSDDEPAPEPVDSDETEPPPDDETGADVISLDMFRNKN